MKNYLYGFALSITAMILSGCSVFGIRGGNEQLDYKVIDTIQSVEVRQYPPSVVAQVSNMKNRNEAFRVLFRYISGQNNSNQKVSMTSPVQVDTKSMKIAMTAPVEISTSDDNSVSMRFFLPSSMSVDSAPKPNDPRISIIAEPEEVLAVGTYSGSGSEDRFRNESDKLLKILDGSKWEPVSLASFRGYDPPFTIPFLRRNEVIVKVKVR
jgi:hypothetical protein